MRQTPRKVPPKLPAVVKNMLATRAMRVHHYLFHQSRNQWNTLDAETQQEIRNLGCAPPRPARDSNGNYITNNNAGEDFLYMHRQMIGEINAILAKGNYTYGKRIVGWVDVPPPRDPDWPVPPAFWLDDSDTTAFIRNIKSDNYYTRTLKPLNDRFKNPAYLRTLTLSQLGALVEFQIHNPMHVRWSSSVSSYRPDPDVFYETDTIASRWDTVTYDWMNDFYASHVNEVFWKLHGWVDNRINDWQRANGITTIQWKGTWTGCTGHDHSGMNMFTQIFSKEHKEKRDKVFKLLAQSGKATSLVQLMTKPRK
jgi:hypothetical protein